MRKHFLTLQFSILVSVSLILPIVAQSQTSPLKPGSPAPELGFKKLLQAPDGTRSDLASLKGKVVVLEFWATWCAPCIALQPHLNELAERFKDKPVQFISITDEAEEIVAPFLSRRTVKTWVGLDPGRTVHKAYEIDRLPKTILIGKTGRIATVTRADLVNDAMLNELLVDPQPGIQPNAVASQQPDKKPGEMKTAPAGSGIGTIGNQQAVDKPADSKPAEPNPSLLEISIRPAAPEGMIARQTMIRPGTRQYKAMSATLRQILAVGVGLNFGREVRIEVPEDLRNQRFDVTASVSPDKAENLKPLIVNAFEKALGISITRITREMDAYVLTAPKTPLTGALQPSKAKEFHSSSAKGVIAASAADLDKLEMAIEMLLKTPVVNETGLAGKFDWNLVFDGDYPTSILEAIRKEFGLEIALVKKPIEFFVVRK